MVYPVITPFLPRHAISVHVMVILVDVVALDVGAPGLILGAVAM